MIAGERRVIAVEDAARYRDALGVPLPPGLPHALLEPVRDPAGDLALRFARSHAPFTAAEFAARYGLGVGMAEALLVRLTESGRLIEGEFRPGGTAREWVDADVLRSLRRRSLAKLRHEIEPVGADALGRFLVSWHGIGSGRHGLEALLDAIEQLQGAAIPASVLEREVLPARVSDYQPAMLDTLMAAGEVVWAGIESLGERDGRIAMYLTDHFARLRAPAGRTPSGSPSEQDQARSTDILEYLREHGASFFAAIHEGTGGGFPQETVDALWDLVWQGLVTNDTLHALRAYSRTEDRQARRRDRSRPFRSRRLVPPSAEGRWSLLPTARATKATNTEWAAAMAQQLLTRHGVITRETVAAEALAGGFTAVYDVLKAMEDTGRVRRGYFVAGLGAAQFAMPAALDLLRSMRDVPEEPRTALVAATDPANPYGAIVKWPEPSPAGTSEPSPETGRGPTRSAGALAILVDGAAAAYLRRGERELRLFLPEAEPQRSRVGREVARALLQLAGSREPGKRGLLIAEINGLPAHTHPAAQLFVLEGFVIGAMGLQARPGRGIGLAGPRAGGSAMTDQTGETIKDRDQEHDEIRSSNDRDQNLEREGVTSRHNRGYDEAAKGAESSESTDPDSADAENDRDDMIND
jgi:ATP-dependent Lhr-like helicase